MKLRQMSEHVISIKGIMLSVRLMAISVQRPTPSSDYSAKSLAVQLHMPMLASAVP